MRAPPEQVTAMKGIRVASGPLDRPRHLFAHRRPHAAPHEAKLHHREADRMAADPRRPAEKGLLHPRGLAGRPQTVDVALLVLEFQRVERAEGGVPFLEAARVHQRIHARPGPEAKVVLATGAHIEILREFGLGEDLLAALALDPEPLGYPDPGVLPSRKRIFLEPSHAPLPPESAYGSRPPEVCQEGPAEGPAGPSRDAGGHGVARMRSAGRRSRAGSPRVGS